MINIQYIKNAISDILGLIDGILLQLCQRTTDIRFFKNVTIIII